ncbi:MAG: hypothetical protein K0Q90_1372 [Paenibacillaceae bacterium]|nr:hypothetical protein [Paenibacillaceae bacterium]
MKLAKTMKAAATIGILTVSAVMFTACGGDSESTGGASSPAGSAPAAATAAASAPAASAAAKASGKELKASEKLAQEFVNVMMNGTDAEAKKKFIADNVHDDLKPLFELLPNGEKNPVSPTYEAIKNPKPVETVKIEEDGQKAEAVLVQGDSKKEAVILLMDGKIGFAFTPDSADADANEMYAQMRKEFKTAAAK